MSCKYNNCKHCGYKSECEIYKENADLEEKISVLLSCKKCPENKGGLICQKEYEGKCLAQKIQYIKELQEENLKLEAKVRTLEIEQNYCLPNCSKIANLEKENAELGKELDYQKQARIIAENAVVDLTKEIAELKNRIKTLTIHDTNAVLSGLEMKVLKESHRNRANKTQDQLTKAKVCLEQLVSEITVGELEVDPNVLQQAENFLSEVEK